MALERGDSEQKIKRVMEKKKSAKAAAETQDWINGPNEVDMWCSGAGRAAAENRNKKKKPLYLYTGRLAEQQR